MSEAAVPVFMVTDGSYCREGRLMDRQFFDKMRVCDSDQM